MRQRANATRHSICSPGGLASPPLSPLSLRRLFATQHGEPRSYMIQERCRSLVGCSLRNELALPPAKTEPGPEPESRDPHPIRHTRHDGAAHCVKLSSIISSFTIHHPQQDTKHGREP
eukprot:scaffold36316_cov114-Isochrysis_galbana.AAC.5